MNKVTKIVYIIVLNYKDKKDTLNSVVSMLKNLKYPNYKIVMVDNNSQDGSYELFESEAEKLSKQYGKEIKAIGNNTNFGYAHGNNIGIKYALKSGADYICLMNPDVTVTEDFLSVLINQMEKDSSIGIIGPAEACGANGEICEQCGANIGKITGTTKLLNSGKTFSQINNKIYDCDYVCGACLITKKEVLEKVGLLPENYFLYFEETEWCRKIRKAGYRCVACAHTKILHKGSATVNKEAEERSEKEKNKGLNFRDYYMYRNRVVYQKRNTHWFCFVPFLVYYFAEILYCAFKKKCSWNMFLAYLDGISGKDRFNCIIKENYEK